MVFYTTPIYYHLFIKKSIVVYFFAVKCRKSKADAIAHAHASALFYLFYRSLTELEITR